MKRYFRKFLRILAWTIGIIIILLLLILIAIQIPAVQNFLKDQAVSYLEDKIKTKVVIDDFEMGFPKKFKLSGVYLENQQNDTLLYAKELDINLNTFGLLSNKLEINSIDLDGMVANVSRNQAGVFNFDYIMDAFASKEVKKDSSAPMEISLNKINLDKIRIKFEDDVTQNYVNLNLNHFDTKVEKFDLQNLDFSVPIITLDGLKVNLKQGLLEEITKETEELVAQKSNEPVLKLYVEEINLSNIDLGYESETTKLKTQNTIGQLLVMVNSIDLEKQIIDIDSFTLDNTKSSLVFGKRVVPAITSDTTAVASNSNNWQLKINNANINELDFYFDDANSAPLKRGIDYKHLDIKNLNLDAEKLVYAPKLIAGSIVDFEVTDKSGVQIDSLTTDFAYGETGSYLKKLYLKTPQTEIKDEIVIGYTSMDAMADNIGEMEINAALKGSRIGFKDVLLFVPGLANTNPFKSNPNAILYLNSEVSGKVNDITIPYLELSGIGRTKIAASGRITGLPDVKTAYFDLNLKQLQSSSKDLKDFIPEGTIPNNIQIPATLVAKGTFKGTLDNFMTNMNVNSSSGNAKIKGSFDSRRKDREKYDAIVYLENFDLGYILKNDSIGKITLNAKAKGIGLNPKKANATVQGTIVQAGFNGYNYQNLALNGKIAHGDFNATADMDDPNLAFDLDAEGGFGGKYPKVKLKMNLDIADLEKLNLHAGPLKLRGNVDADIETLDVDYLNGQVHITQFNFANATEQFALDSINITAMADAERNTILLKSQFANAEVDGKYKLSELASAITNSVSKYYDTGNTAKKPTTSPQQLAFKIDVKSDPILLKIVPNLTSLEPISISGKYNTVNDSIVIVGRIPKLTYGANTISNATIDVTTEDNALVYNLHVDDVQNASFRLPYTNLSGKVADNVVAYDLLLKDLGNKDQYAISGTLEAKNNGNTIHLDPESLLLNYENWTIPTGNVIVLGENGILIDDFGLSNEGSSLKVQSQSNTENAPIDVDFIDFDIATISNIIKKDNLEIGGKLDGRATLKDLKTTATFTSDLNIEDFSFNKDTLGNINIKVDNQTANALNANVAISGQDNDVTLAGVYRTDNASFDMNLDINKLHLKSIQGFTMGNVTESTGFLSGQFEIQGTANQPQVNGDLQFNDVGLKVTQLNSTFKGINDKITIDSKGLNFGTFTINDENNNKLVLRGEVLTQNFRDYGFNLDINADNFQAVDSGAKDNDLYYGKLFIDTRLKVRGDLNQPAVQGNITINEDTDFTIVLPQSDPSIADREGIVAFVDKDNPPMITKLTVADTLSQTQFRGIDASVNIIINKEAAMSIIIDKSNGDFLKLKGEANLNGGMDASGKTTLTGRYEFTEGSYEMTFNLLKRKFDIKAGSYIIWTGEPTAADVNITAVYKTEASPIDLLSGSPDAYDDTFKQRIDFETELIMKGELLKPEITFDIVLPEGNNDVSTEIINATQNRLTQLRQEPSELNKQVFALLLLNRFIGENPFASEAGSTSAGTLAKQSASKILSQQMNNLAADLIEGVELNFDMVSTEDYSSGQRDERTDLNVGISKELLDDRLKVTVGSSFELEGSQQANRETNNIAGDVSIDYQLSKDGRYMVRAYRKDLYQVALQGQVVETGVAFIMTMDYNKFREIFTNIEKKRKERQERRKKLREANGEKEENDDE